MDAFLYRNPQRKSNDREILSPKGLISTILTGIQLIEKHNRLGVSQKCAWRTFMDIQHDPLLLQQTILQHKRQGKTIGFVPTMGALHAGHTSLMDIARPLCDILICSIYVNPLQFAPTEDLSTYPHTPELDHHMCREHGVDIVLRPSTLYHPLHNTRVEVHELTNGLCGASRPSHFAGVTTVVARLFGLVQPDVAVFGEKDFQQLAVIRRMTEDLAMPIQIIGGPIVRDESGLALSSRNAYLTPTDKQRALSLSRTLQYIQQTIQNNGGCASVADLLQQARTMLDVDSLDYLEIVNPVTLRPLDRVDGAARALVAAKVGKPRLIDNLDVSIDSPSPII